MELARFDTLTNANAGVEIELKDLKTGMGSGAFVRVLGSDGDVFQRLKSDRTRKIAKRLQETGGESLPQEEIDDMTCEMLAACTINWRGLTDGGKEVPFSLERAKAVYRQYPAIRDQVNIAIGDRSLFLLA